MRERNLRLVEYGRLSTNTAFVRPSCRVEKLIGPLVVILIIALGQTALDAQEIRRQLLPDGVERWYRVQTDVGRSSLAVLRDKLLRYFQMNTLPFDRSVAFVAGVSEYENLTDLPFVKNDVEDVRDYLLSHGEFDEVYVARESVVTREVIEDYMINRFPRDLGPRDRLLFYYAGHGDDTPNGTTGYVLFRDARPSDFARSVLPVQSRTIEWSNVNRAGHMLFIFDACASGMGWDATRAADDHLSRGLIQTLSGRGSRAVLTAGTGKENTYEVKGSDGRGNGVFTRAMLNALRGVADAGTPDGFITSDELIARIRREVAEFQVVYGTEVTPRKWDMRESEYPGTFVFLNPSGAPGPVPPVRVPPSPEVSRHPSTAARRTALDEQWMTFDQQWASAYQDLDLDRMINLLPALATDRSELSTHFRQLRSAEIGHKQCEVVMTADASTAVAHCAVNLRYALRIGTSFEQKSTLWTFKLEWIDARWQVISWEG